MMVASKLKVQACEQLVSACALYFLTVKMFQWKWNKWEENLYP